VSFFSHFSGVKFVSDTSVVCATEIMLPRQNDMGERLGDRKQQTNPSFQINFFEKLIMYYSVAKHLNCIVSHDII
jgi:hypothetical protein